MIDGPRPRPPPPPPKPASKPAATSSTARSSTPTSVTAAEHRRDTFEVRGSPAAQPVDQAKEAAQGSVEVSDTDVKAQREEVRAEGQRAVDQTRTDLTQRAEEIRSHQDDDNYQVEIREEDDKTVYIEREIGDGSTITRETYLEVSNDQPPKARLEETRQEGDHFVQEHQQVEGTGSDYKLDNYKINFEEYPGGPPEASPFGGGSVGYDPGRISQEATTFEADGGNVSKSEEKLTFGDYGQLETTDLASASFQEKSGDDVDLPGQIDDVFQDSQPVIESNINISREDAEGNRTVVADEHHWSQGKVRVSERSGEDQPTSLLVERQSEDGQSKDSQLFFKGAQETVTTHTELNPDGSVTETQKLYDSNEGQVGNASDTRPELQQTTTSTRTYDDQGHVATQHRESEDTKTGERRVEDYQRTVENGVATYQTHQEIIPKEGDKSVTDITQRALVHADGEKPLSTTIQGDGHTVEITEDSRGRHYTDTNDQTGEVIRGEVRKSGDGIALEINGRTLELNSDGTFKDADQLDDLDPAEFSALPFLTTGAGGIKGLVNSLGQDATQAEANIAEAIKDHGGADKLKAAGQFFGAASSAMKTLEDLRNGDYLQAALDATKTGVQGTQLAGSLLGKFEAASKLGKALGVAGGAIDIASGIYGVFKADNDYDRATSGLNIVEGGLGVALALTAASGPAAPFLFAGIVGIEVVKAFIGHAKAEYVPPLSAELAGQQGGGGGGAGGSW